MNALSSALLCCLAGLLGGCVNTEFHETGATTGPAVYAAAFPYYAESCAVSELLKRPGTLVDIESGGPGGHSVLYLNGVCRRHDTNYPVVVLCPGAPGPDDGVGISVNAHYRNANWTATEGRDFFFHGDLAPGEALTQAGFTRTLARARAQGVLDGVRFQAAALAARPASMSEQAYMYEISIATDFALNLGRDRYCARVALDRARMGGIVDFLNGVNVPYRSGARTFRWDVLRDNCAHLTHNALATVGLWRPWPTERPLLIAAFDFPVPKNEFVNLMRRTNDLPIDDPAAIFADPVLRDALERQDWLATRPGGLAEAEPVVQDNALFGTRLRLILFDEVIFGHYRAEFQADFRQPRTTDLAANFSYFKALYTRILADRVPSPPGRAGFDALYYAHIAGELDALRALTAPGAS